MVHELNWNVDNKITVIYSVTKFLSRIILKKLDNITIYNANNIQNTLENLIETNITGV